VSNDKRQPPEPSQADLGRYLADQLSRVYAAQPSQPEFRKADPLTLEAIERAITEVRSEKVYDFEGRRMTVDEIRRMLYTFSDQRLQEGAGKHRQDGIDDLFRDEINRRFDAGPETPENAIRRQLAQVQKELRERDLLLRFREACDAAYAEGQIARSIGLDIHQNPYVGEGPAERISPDHRLIDFHIPWILGWRHADEQGSVDQILAVAQAATRDGRVTPACPQGDALREAVVAYLARKD
jgi:hypothetical protein